MIGLHRHDWVVYAERPFDAPQHLIRYLGRYVNRIAIANHRIEAIDATGVTFRYRDNRVKDPDAPGAEKRMRLPGTEFLRRFLQHVLPPGFHQIRYYGLLAGGRRKVNLTRCRALLGLDNPEQPYIADPDAFLAKQAIDHSLCPVCGKGHLRNVFQLLSFVPPCLPWPKSPRNAGPSPQEHPCRPGEPPRHPSDRPRSTVHSVAESPLQRLTGPPRKQQNA
jgi:hypothetical protein